MSKTTSEEFKQSIRGEAQGTTWQVVYYDLQERDLKPQVDSILNRIDQSVSTYLKGSAIDRWNASENGSKVDPLFVELLMKSWNLYQASNGSFDPTVKPLVSYWGFGPERFEHPETADPALIDSMLQLVDFDTLSVVLGEESYALDEFYKLELPVDSVFLVKPMSGMQLDFNAVGQGWSVDHVANYLLSLGLKIYFVEIGGEISVGYPKPDASLWRFGIDKPSQDNFERELQAIINLRNKALATSGNYRKFYEKDGVRFSHTIDPTTGYPVQHSLLSTTVVSEDAATADAMATAFMVMGKDSTIRFVNEKHYLSNYVYLIYDEGGKYETHASHQIETLIEDVENKH